jgi:AraC-like DNA-binding protein
MAWMAATSTAARAYDDVGGFPPVFRKIMGLTPSQYRQRFSRIG